MNFCSSLFISVINSWLKERQLLDLKETQNAILNGTFDYSKSPDQFYMVKKHKCASSTFLGVITAYQLWRGITTEPPVFGAMAGAYPAPFDSRFRVRPTYEGVSFKEHSVNNPNFMPNAFRVTTVREPTSHFFSVFNYFYYRHDEDKLYVAPGTPHSV